MIKIIYWIVAICLCIFLYWYAFSKDNEGLSVIEIMKMFFGAFPFMKVNDGVVEIFWALLIPALSISWPLALIIYKVIKDGVNIVESDLDQFSEEISETKEKVEEVLEETESE